MKQKHARAIRPLRMILSVSLLTLLAGTAITVLDVGSVASAQDTTPKASQSAPSAEPAAAAPADIPSSSDNGCLSDPAVLNELSKRRAALDAKERALQSEEAELKNREAALNDEFTKLKSLRDQITKLNQAQQAAKQGKVEKVIETLQAMSPNAAAQFLSSLDDRLAVSAMAKMDTVKLAKIMNKIDPQRGARLTELLAGVVRAQNPATQDARKETASNDAAATTIPPQVAGKGGENNGTSNKPETIISGGPNQPGSKAN